MRRSFSFLELSFVLHNPRSHSIDDIEHTKQPAVPPRQTPAVDDPYQPPLPKVPTHQGTPSSAPAYPVASTSDARSIEQRADEIDPTMRSHPYTPPPPLPPILDELAALVPLANERRSQDDLGVPMADLDPETSQLLPARKKRHRVRVQGRLAVVRSVSTANLGSPTGAAASSPSSGPNTPRFESGVAGGTEMPSPRRRRRRSLDDGGYSDLEEDDVRETAIRDRQLRGYGIGGAGNIRRPTDVYGSSSRSNSSSLSRLYSSAESPAGSPDKRWWNLRGLIGRVSDRKGKAPQME